MELVTKRGEMLLFGNSKFVICHSWLMVSTSMLTFRDRLVLFRVGGCVKCTAEISIVLFAVELQQYTRYEN